MRPRVPAAATPRPVEEHVVDGAGGVRAGESLIEAVSIRTDDAADGIAGRCRAGSIDAIELNNTGAQVNAGRHPPGRRPRHSAAHVAVIAGKQKVLPVGRSTQTTLQGAVALHR